MDPIEQMLIEKYGLTPEKAKAAAADIKGGGANPLGKPKEAGAVAGDEQARMRRLQYNATMFKQIADAKKQGLEVYPEDEAWYQQVAAHGKKPAAAPGVDINKVAQDELLRMAGMTEWGKSETAKLAPQTYSTPNPNTRPGDVHSVPASLARTTAPKDSPGYGAYPGDVHVIPVPPVASKPQMSPEDLAKLAAMLNPNTAVN